MNTRTTYKILDFLSSKGVEAYGVEEVEMGRENLNIYYINRPGALSDAYELIGSTDIGEFLEYLTSE